MMLSIHSVVVSIAFWLTVFVSDAHRSFCPPKHFVLNINRTIQGYRTALIFEIHGKLFVSQLERPVYWTEYPSGAAVSRNIYNHIGILGIDRVFINVFYNESLFPKTPPTVEDIFPSKEYCVSDWYKLGVIDWRPKPFGGPIENWPLNAQGKPSLDKNVYKTDRGSNIIFDEIRNQTDYIFLLDVDEFLVPVNFNTSNADHKWCRKAYPPLISRILEQMLITATTSKLDSYATLKNSSRDGDVLPSNAACMMGYSYSFWQRRCLAVESIYFPSYVWLREKSTTAGKVPTLRSKYPAFYSWYLRAEDNDGWEQLWKSVFVSKFNPPMRGMAIHDNPNGLFRILAPRSYHGRLSLELSHTRTVNFWHNETWDQQYLTNDTRLVDLYEVYKRCAKSE